MEMSRALFYWNTAAGDSSGARLAVVCDQDASAIKTKMQAMLGVLEADQINVTYSPDGCDSNSCRSVTVSINGFNFTTLVPVLPLNIQMPSFRRHYRGKVWIALIQIVHSYIRTNYLN